MPCWGLCERLRNKLRDCKALFPVGGKEIDTGDNDDDDHDEILTTKSAL